MASISELPTYYQRRVIDNSTFSEELPQASSTELTTGWSISDYFVNLGAVTLTLVNGSLSTKVIIIPTVDQIIEGIKRLGNTVGVTRAINDLTGSTTWEFQAANERVKYTTPPVYYSTSTIGIVVNSTPESACAMYATNLGGTYVKVDNFINRPEGHTTFDCNVVVGANNTPVKKEGKVSINSTSGSEDYYSFRQIAEQIVFLASTDNQEANLFIGLVTNPSTWGADYPFFKLLNDAILSSKYPRGAGDEYANLERFTWDKFNFSTEYVEPFSVARAGNNETQLTKQYKLPQRRFELEFSTMYYVTEFFDRYWMHELEISFKRLRNFYERHGTHKKFILNHPVYGDCVCRFYAPLEIPKKLVNGNGALEAFKISLTEEISRDYYLHPQERQFEDMQFSFPYNRTVVKYPVTSSPIALGDNYTMIIRDHQKPLRKFQVNIPILFFKQGSEDQIRFSCSDNLSVMMLELFYLNKRLDRSFNFVYEGEVITVKFDKELSIPTIKGNKGGVVDINIELMETNGALRLTDPEKILPLPDPCALTSRPYAAYLDEIVTTSFKLDMSMTREPLNKTDLNEAVIPSISVEQVMFRNPVNKTDAEIEAVIPSMNVDQVYFRSVLNKGVQPEDAVIANLSVNQVYYRTPLNRTTQDLDQVKTTFSVDEVFFRSVINKSDTYTENLKVGIQVLNSKYTKEVVYLSESLPNPENLKVGIQVLNSKYTYEVRYLSRENATPEKVGYGIQMLDSQITYQIRYLSVNIVESIGASIVIHDSKIIG